MEPADLQPDVPAPVSGSAHARRPPAPGLSADEVLRRRAAGMGNDVDVRTGRTYEQIVRQNVFNFINNLFFTLGIILVVLGRYLDALVSVCVVLANTVVSLVQEVRAKQTIDRIAILTRPKATAVRDGEFVDIDPGQIVVGDLLFLHPGDQVVVDGRMVGEGHMEVDESLLTGESDLVAKRPGDELLSGSFCVTGSGYYEAERVGLDSYANKLTARATSYKRELTPLQNQVSTIIRILLFIVIGFDILVWVRAYTGGIPFVEGVRMSTVVVALIPNGLVLSIAFAYALGAVRMLGKGMLIQTANAVESLSNVDVLCTDKTGTLTSNVIRVKEVLPLGAPRDELERLLAVYAASTTDVNRTVAALQQAYPAEAVEAADEALFSSRRKWSGLVFAADDLTGTYVLGAPEAIAPALTGDAGRAGAPPGGEAGDADWRAQAAAWTEQGLRVLMFAGRPEALAFGEPSRPLLPPGLAPLGLICLSDELRPHVRQTLDQFAKAGIELKIISGDDPQTVASLARQAGLRRPAGADDPPDGAGDEAPDLVAVSGADLEGLGPAGLADTAERATIFGRVTPEQKRDLIHALRERGRHVAMIGDGVNDVVALKEANVGVAMQNGSQAARGVADLVLLKDSFAALPYAFREGQRIINGMHDILRIFMVRILSKAAIIAIITTLGGFPFAPRQASYISFVGAGVPAAFLAWWAIPGPVPKVRLYRLLARFVLPAMGLLVLGAVAIYYIYALPARSSYLAAHPGAGAEDLLVHALPPAQTAITVFVALCSILLLPLTVPPSDWWSGGARKRGDGRILLLTFGLLVFHALVVGTPIGRTLFEIAPLPLWQHILLAFAGVAWMMACRRIWRSGALDTWLGTMDDPYPKRSLSAVRQT
ncbi:MAG TPA: HAD-IC family P-type ATPase [Thermoleophilia bacterium]|nr:HAD-IC family P-type ATPase [Thermoleophilia bacterium]